jgi:hypothetical protein
VKKTDSEVVFILRDILRNKSFIVVRNVLEKVFSRATYGCYACHISSSWTSFRTYSFASPRTSRSIITIEIYIYFKCRQINSTYSKQYVPKGRFFNMKALLSCKYLHFKLYLPQKNVLSCSSILVHLFTLCFLLLSVLSVVNLAFVR